ncbi:cytochrome P450 [Pyrenochaeta sp. DS3sAY3a]|nr:cytochrome P450 [Pyrenochaeta sp. DS3sAY3a]
MPEHHNIVIAIGNPRLSVHFLVLSIVLIGIYVVYYRYFHPLSKFPGPFLASFTNVWKAYHLSTLRMPETITKLHEEYGSVVRVGPNDLSFNSGSAVTSIYKAGRSLPKTSFYNGFTAFNPNLFGTQDDELHALRRRQMSHAFSLQSIKDMELLINKHIDVLCANLDSYVNSGQIANLKELIAFYVLDVLGELAFSQSFNAQVEKNLETLPPINDHIYLACLMGQMPEMMPMLHCFARYLPLPWTRKLMAARARLKSLTAACVRRRLNDKGANRKDLLGCLIRAVDPETGARLTELDINTEAFAMLVAGSHTTSGTLTLLFSHLLQNREILDKVVAEIDTILSPKEQAAHGAISSIEGLELSLPYTMACLQENFRINPVFSMPLPRRVAVPGGMKIDGFMIPQNTTVFALNHAVHHNPAIFGPDNDMFKPSRFEGAQADELRRNLSPFSMGHRMCIGRNMAMANLLKVLTTVLRRYELEAVGLEDKIRTLSVGISEKEGQLMCRVRRRQAC